MDQYSVLGSLAKQLNQEFVHLYYVFLPVFFALAVMIEWFRNPTSSPGFLDILKRAIIATLLVASFQEISEAILALANGVAERISDMSGFDTVFRMAKEKCSTYPMSAMSLVLGFDDAVMAILSFLSYVGLFFARYITVALYHFMWVFLSILAPLLMLFNLFKGTQAIPINVFRSMIEVASWKIVWAVMSAMLTALSFGNVYTVDGSYLTLILLNFIIALAMLATPLVVKSLIGSGLSSMAESLGMAAALAMTAAPARAVTALKMGREVLSHTSGFGGHVAGRAGSALWNGMRSAAATPQPYVPSDRSPVQEPLPPSRQLPAPPIYMGAPDGYFGHDPRRKR